MSINTLPQWNNGDKSSLVEQVFDSPDNVCEGEYIAIYEFLLSPDICDDPDLIAGVLREFTGWSRHMLRQMYERGLIASPEADE